MNNWKETTVKDVKNKLINAYLTLLKNDVYLLEVDASERSIVHRFAVYLEKEFPKWNVDCEYNKNFSECKSVLVWENKLIDIIKTGKNEEEIRKILQHGVSVYPDIIIHHRGTNDNFIVIEAKKSSNPSDGDSDRQKLQEYKKHDGLKYKYAFFVQFPINAREKFYINEFIEEIDE